MNNPVGLQGIEFIEFSSSKPDHLDQLFKAFGFSKTMKHSKNNVFHYSQGQINLLVNQDATSFAHSFEKKHGPCVSSMGWRVADADVAVEKAVAKGAKKADKVDYFFNDGEPVPAIFGIGDSLIYFIDDYNERKFYGETGFEKLKNPEMVPTIGFEFIDHLTNNVYEGTMSQWSDFYKNIFGFTEIKYFDIRGAKTGLTSFALKSPCETFCIPINEGTEKKSQINEYLEEYNGPGVQHIAFSTTDIVSTLAALSSTDIETLDIDDQYYKEVFDRVPNVSEPHSELQKYNILVDGDDEGYLLQIFTKNIIGPIFIEIIQRKNHFAFGEGNFGALFRSIERDQEKRGYLK